MNLSDKLKAARKKKGLTQKKLAENLGVVLSVIGDTESGRRNPSKVTALKLAEYFNTPVEYWLNEKETTEIDTYFSNRNKNKMFNHVLKTLVDSGEITNEEISDECWELLKDAVKIEAKILVMNKKNNK